MDSRTNVVAEPVLANSRLVQVSCVEARAQLVIFLDS